MDMSGAMRKEGAMSANRLLYPYLTRKGAGIRRKTQGEGGFYALGADRYRLRERARPTPGMRKETDKFYTLGILFPAFPHILQSIQTSVEKS